MVSSVTNLPANAAKRYLEINNMKMTRATEELASGLRASNPSYDPSSSAVGYSLTANVQSLNRASRNVSQGQSMIQMSTGVLGATSDTLTRMKELTVSSNSDTIGPEQRSMMDEEFQQLLDQVTKNALGTRWGGISLFSGGAGSATHSGAVAEAQNGMTAVANAFAATLNANSQGFITGVATAATVRANGGLYDVSVTVGNQTFTGTVPVVDSGTLTLTSTVDSGNVLILDYDAAATTGITDAATFQTSLQTLLGINATSGSAAAFYSLSTNDAVATGGAMTVVAGAGTTAGLWALSYTGAAAGGTGVFKITNGAESYTQSVLTSAAAMAQTINFSNGMNITLTNAFDGTANVAQETYFVTEGTGINLSFQYAEKATDVLGMTFNGVTAAALGLVGQDIKTRPNAARASLVIDAALTQVGTQIAQLGGKATQLTFMKDTLMINIQNQIAARASFVDADIAESMLNMQNYKGLSQVAGTVFTQALNEQANLTQMVQNVR